MMEEYFFFLFFSPHLSIPRRPHRGVPVAPAMLMEQLRRGQVRGLAGMVYSSLSQEMIYTCCREMEWNWEIGAGMDKAKSQLNPLFPHCLSFPQPGRGQRDVARGVPKGAYNKLCTGVGVAQQLPEPHLPSERREQPLLSAAHLGGDAKVASPAGIPLTQGTCAPIETLHLHFTLPFLLFLWGESRWLHF